MAFHSAKSPSKTTMFAACAGSLTMAAAIPEIHRNVAGHAAKRGTATHYLNEVCLKAGKHPRDFAERIIVLIEHDDGDDETSMLKPNAKLPKAGTDYFIVDEDMIASSAVLVEYVRKRCKELGVAESDLELETRTNPLPDREDTSGTADVTINGFVRLVLADYKNGYLHVDTNSKQLWSYLLGKAIDTGWSHEEYEIVVVQPNSETGDPEPRSLLVTAAQLKAYQKELRGYVEKCDEAADAKGAPEDNGRDYLNPDPQWVEEYLNAGERGEHCTFCDAKAWCPALQAIMAEAASVAFDEEPPESLEVPKTEEGLARMLAWKDVFNSYFAAVVAASTRAAQNGFAVPGWKLAPSRTNRKFNPELGDEADIRAKLAKRAKFFGLDPAKYMEPPKLKSGPQIEKMVPAKKREQFEAEFLFKPEGALTLVRDTDAREGVEPPDLFPDDDMEDFG